MLPIIKMQPFTVHFIWYSDIILFNPYLFLETY